MQYCGTISAMNNVEQKSVSDKQVQVWSILWMVTWLLVAGILFAYRTCNGGFLGCTTPTRPYSYIAVVVGVISSVILNSRRKQIASYLERRSSRNRPTRAIRFDAKFNKFVAPTIISILYVLLNLLALLFVILFWLREIETVSSNGDDVALFALWSFPLAAVGMAVLWLIIRLICESAIVRFRVAEDLRQIRNRSSQ
jgi:hypothetical protein